MRWQAAWMCALSLVLLTGCPEEYGKDGTMDQAALQDAVDRIQKRCSEQQYLKHCKDKELSAECHKECGG